MTKKKLLMLGGSDIQISAIKRAKELGYYVITADYLPGNPGHQYSDEYHDVSTTDLDGILELSKKLKINGVSSYASDPSALTASYVGEALNLECNPFKSIQILSDKITFRGAQKSLGIPYPKFAEVTNAHDAQAFLSEVNNACIVKPVDSSGSKGIHKVDSDSDVSHLLEDSLSFSRANKIILEEFIVRVGFLMSGDVLVDNGEIVFQCFGDVHFNESVNGLVPRSISLPASKDKTFFDNLTKQLSKLFKSLNIVTGAFNIDVIETPNGDPMVIDIGARNGGNMLNDIIQYHTGFDLISASLTQCMGDGIVNTNESNPQGCYSHYVLHSDKSGIFNKVTFSDEIEKRIIYKKVNISKGDKINRFINSGCRLGLLLLKYQDFDDMHTLLTSNLRDHVSIKFD